MLIVTKDNLLINTDYIAYVWTEESTGRIFAEMHDNSEIVLGEYKDAENADLATKKITQCWGGISTFHMPKE